ncbi:MAG: hypothetical protein AAGF53_18255 [Pseudomonadota bacterium]
MQIPNLDTNGSAEEADPNSHLVLIVHGIGEQVAGHTVDEVVAGALARHPDRPSDDWSDTGIEIRSSHLSLTEENFGNAPDTDIQKTFACHTYAIDPNDPEKHKCVLTEVHWSDLSPAPSGAFATIFDLIQLVLGLGYIAMDNVENIEKHWLPRGIVHFFNWIFYGAIAVVNAMLLIGVLLLTLRSYFPEVGYMSAMCGNAIFGFVVWYLLYRRRENTRRFLVTVFRRGTFLWSTVTLACLSFLFAFPHTFNSLFVYLWGLVPQLLSDLSTECTDYALEAYVAGLEPGVRPDFGFKSASCFVEMNIMFVGILWALTAILTFASLYGYLHRKRKHVIYPAICAAMIIFWSLVASGFWLAVRQIFDQFDLSEDDCKPSTLGQVSDQLNINLPRSEFEPIYDLFCDHLDKVLGTLTLSALTLFTLVSIGLYLQAKGKRVIVHWILRLVLATFPFLMLFILFRETGGPDTVWTRIGTAVVAATLGAAILVYNFNEIVSGVLGVARDVIVYLRRDKCLWLAKPEDRETNYPFREQIEARFERVLSVMLGAVNPHRLTIISHSQGTVIAARTLKRLMPTLQDTRPKLAENLLFITMGSPISHIYDEYFPENYGIRRTEIASNLNWHNLYRSQDFVGRTVNSVGLAAGCDYEVGPGGHSHYFSDRRVWRILWGKVGFRLFTDQ